MTSNTRTAGTQDVVLVEHSLFDSFLKATSACDKFFNCAYVKKQLEDEWQQEEIQQKSAVGRVWNKMEKSLEVEVYRQFLFDESSVGPDTPSQESSNLASLLYCGNEDDTTSIPDLQRTNS